jgi:hypothetical protein
MGVVEDIKEIAEFIRQHGNDDLLKKVMDLQEQILKLSREETQLKIQLKDVKTKFNIHAKMKYQKPFYVKEGDAQPFCAVCWENDHKAIHLTGPLGEVDSSKRYYSCNVCNNWFYV